MISSRRDVLFGVILGGWLGFFYALSTMLLNWLFMPGIPLKPFQGETVFGYFLLYFFIGAVLGLVTSLPSSSLLGVVLGGFSSALVVSIAGVLQPAEQGETLYRAFFIFAYTFLPTGVLLMPAAWVIRIGVNAQHPDLDHPELWARKYLVLALISLGVFAIGSFSFHNPDEREGFRIVNDLIHQAQQAHSASELPAPFSAVSGYWEQARGEYTLSYSDDIENFMGPQPVGDQLLVFLIVAEYDSGLRFACIFQGGETRVPSCTNF